MGVRRKHALIAVGIVTLFLLALIFLLPAIVKVDRYRPQAISYLQGKTGKQVEIGRLAQNFSLVDTPLVTLSAKGNARFSGNLGSFPVACTSQPASPS